MKVWNKRTMFLLGAFCVAQITLSLIVIGMAASEASYDAWWALAGGIGFAVFGVFGMVAALAENKPCALFFVLVNLVPVAFVMTSAGLYIRNIRVDGIVLPPIATALIVFDFLSMAVGICAWATDLTALVTFKHVGPPHTVWTFDEEISPTAYRLSRTIMVLILFQMLFAIPALVMGAVDGSKPGWYCFGGSITIFVAGVIGLLAWGRARLSTYFCYLVLEGIGCGFAFAGTSLFFEFVDKGGVLTSLENGVLAMTFITVIVATTDFIVTIAALAMYRGVKFGITYTAAPVVAAATQNVPADVPADATVVAPVGVVQQPAPGMVTQPTIVVPVTGSPATQAPGLTPTEQVGRPTEFSAAAQEQLAQSTVATQGQGATLQVPTTVRV